MIGPAALHVLGHELRWRLVTELCDSDHKVGELAMATGQAQNLVSYHLRLLREAGLIRERRGSADARDIYYSLDRRAVTRGLLGALAAINPGAGLLTSEQRLGAGRKARPISVLFLCTGNSARSQIAEAILREQGEGRVMVRSAGTHPVGVHPQVYHALAARGIEVGKLRSKSVAQFEGHAFDYVVTLCDIVRTQPMRLVGKPRLIHWSIPDPAMARGGRAAMATAFDRVASEIQVRVEDFYADLRARPSAA